MASEKNPHRFPTLLRGCHSSSFPMLVRECRKETKQKLKFVFTRHPRGLTPAQVSLAWLLAKKTWIVPIPGTTKRAHLQENLMTAGLQFTSEELRDLDCAISKITIHGDRYTAEEQRRVER